MPNATQRFLRVRRIAVPSILSSLCSFSALADSQRVAPKVSRPIVDLQLGAPIY